MTDIKKWIPRILRARIEQHFTQILRYVISGVAGTLLYALVFIILNESILPANEGNLAHERGINYLISNTIAFLFASVLVYILSRNWVFTSGRHNFLKESTLFYGIAITAHLVGTPTGAYLVAKADWNEYLAFGMTVTISVLWNYSGRKWLVFYG